MSNLNDVSSNGGPSEVPTVHPTGATPTESNPPAPTSALSPEGQNGVNEKPHSGNKENNLHTATSPTATSTMVKPKFGLPHIIHIAYGLFALGIISLGAFGASSLAALVLAYYKRSDAAGTKYAVHFDWLISTFWWGGLGLGLSALLTMIYIGWLTGLAVLLWLIYRTVKGWLAHCAHRSPLDD